jgi:hypothetical protein
MSLRDFFDAMAYGSSTMAVVAPTARAYEFRHTRLCTSQVLDKPRSPRDFMRSAWENAGSHLYKAREDVGQEP